MQTNFEYSTFPCQYNPEFIKNHSFECDIVMHTHTFEFDFHSTDLNYVKDFITNLYIDIMHYKEELKKLNKNSNSDNSKKLKKIITIEIAEDKILLQMAKIRLQDLMRVQPPVKFTESRVYKNCKL